MTGSTGDEVGATNEGNCGEGYIVEACVLAIVEDGQTVQNIMLSRP
ncbi:hypothetical protein FOQG_19524 [Fusarium oxysporum f. sp. raphani 54005]|uniref:Uncharacterized protein n=1 Tax=Fusarium oxysporum f. sp. raphani 54005 TaxID=1089458 RepID=X0B0U7_FUSOX|nr:hypothetical protein FOQG_19524 [Fusarium oxysporum f. sp. raphani 54005]